MLCFYFSWFVFIFSCYALFRFFLISFVLIFLVLLCFDFFPVSSLRVTLEFAFIFFVSFFFIFWPVLIFACGPEKHCLYLFVFALVCLVFLYCCYCFHFNLEVFLFRSQRETEIDIFFFLCDEFLCLSCCDFLLFLFLLCFVGVYIYISDNLHHDVLLYYIATSHYVMTTNDTIMIMKCSFILRNAAILQLINL